MARVIASTSRATQILEQIARKHDVVPSVALCCRDPLARACRAEVAWTLAQELGWSTRRSGAFLGYSARTICELIASHKRSMRLHRVFAPASNDEILQRLQEAERTVVALQQEIDRLTGVSFAHRIAQHFGMERWLRGPIVLSILAEAYPKPLNTTRLIDLYSEACDRLNYCAGREVTSMSITKHCALVRDHFADLGLANPIRIDNALAGECTRALTHEAARIMSPLFGVPSLSLMTSGEGVSR